MKNNVWRRETGMALIIVIGVIMIMSLVVVGILSRNISRSVVDEKSIQRYQAEFVARGAFWRLYQNGGVAPANYSETVDGTTYTVTYVVAAGGGPNGTNKVDVTVTY